MTAPAITEDRRASPKRARRDLAAVRRERIAGALDRLATANEGTPWPWEAMNRQADTIVPGDLIVVAAYTGTGKTTLCLNAARIWSAQKTPVLYFGTEQDAADLTLKVACMDLGVPYADARRGRLSKKWAKRVHAAIVAQGEGDRANITFYPGSTPTGDEVLRAIRAAAKQGIGLFVVDYLGHVDLSGFGPSWERTRHFVAALKELAVKLRIAIIVCAQIGNTDGDRGMQRYNKPNIKQIQGGTGVPQEADVVWGVYQPLRPTVKPADIALVHSGEKALWDIVEPYTAAVALLKHREGDKPIGSISMFWVRHNRFTPRLVNQHELPNELRHTEYTQDVWADRVCREWNEAHRADAPDVRGMPEDDKPEDGKPADAAPPPAAPSKDAEKPCDLFGPEQEA